MHFGLIAVNENEKSKNKTLYSLKLLHYRVHHERSNKTASFAEDLKFDK